MSEITGSIRTAGPVETVQAGAAPQRRKRGLGRSFVAAAAIFSGIATLFIGLVCVAVHVMLRGDHMFDQVGSVLLISAIPLMLAGSVFLDDAAATRDD